MRTLFPRLIQSPNSQKTDKQQKINKCHNLLFLAVSYRTRGLVGRHDQHFGYLDMLGQGSSEINHLGHIVARERTKPFIHVVGRSLIAPETHYGEVRLHQSGLDVRHTYGSIHQIYTQTVRQGLYRRLAGTVHAPAGISIVSGNGPRC